MKKSVVLAAEGVLLPRVLDRVRDTAARASGIDRIELLARWQNEAEDAFIRGQLPESYLWEWLGQYSHTDPDLWRETLWSTLCPLASSGFLSRLSRWADLHVVSEIRAEWLRPVLRSEGLLPFLASVSCASETGLRRPDLFALPAPAGSEVYLIDERKFAGAASRLGYRFVEADRRMLWLQIMVSELSGRGPQQHLLPTA